MQESVIAWTWIRLSMLLEFEVRVKLSHQQKNYQFGVLAQWQSNRLLTGWPQVRTLHTPHPVFRTGLIFKNLLDPENVLKLLTSLSRSFRFKSSRPSKIQYNLRERCEVIEMSARSFSLLEIGKTRCGTRELTISFLGSHVPRLAFLPCKERVESSILFGSTQLRKEFCISSHGKRTANPKT